MKIAILRRRFVEHGGGERFVAEFTRRLAAIGHEPHLFAEAWPAAAAGVTVHRVPALGRGSTLSTLGYAWLAPRLARAAGLDLVLSFERTLDQDVLRAGEGCHRQWLELRARHLRGGLGGWRPFHRVVLALERRICLRGARTIAVNSNLVADGLRRHYAPLGAALVVVRNGVDLERHAPAVREAMRAEARRALGLDPEDLALLAVGSGFERKGIATAVRALGDPALARARTVLLVAGRGREASLAALAGRVGARVRFLGLVGDPRPLYAAADLFVLPTVYDPASNATLEALAMGLPVVTTATNGSSEVLAHGCSGWVLADPSDAGALARAIEEARDPERRRGVGAAGRAAVEAFPWERHLQEMLALCVRPA